MGQSRQILWLPVTTERMDNMSSHMLRFAVHSASLLDGPQTKDQLVVDGIELGTKLSAEKWVGGSMGSTNHL